MHGGPTAHPRRKPKFPAGAFPLTSVSATAWTLIHELEEDILTLHSVSADDAPTALERVCLTRRLLVNYIAKLEKRAGMKQHIMLRF